MTMRPCDGALCACIARVMVQYGARPRTRMLLRPFMNVHGFYKAARR